MILSTIVNNILKIPKYLENLYVAGITIDSRKVKKNFIFVAASGCSDNSKDGHYFIEEAINRGACFIVCERILIDYQVPYVKVLNSRIIAAKLLQQFWFNKIHNINIKLCGITGTNGKTSVSFLISYILESMKYNPIVIGSLGIGLINNLQYLGLTTPEAEDLSFLINNNAVNKSHLIIEVSSHGLETNRVDGLNFDIAALTNITSEHLDFHKNINSYENAKFRLFNELLPKNRIAILPFRHKFSNFLQNKNRIITWGVNNKADISAQLVKQDLYGISFFLCRGKVRKFIRTHILGSFQLDNILCASAIALGFGASLDQIVIGLKNIKTIPGRMQKISLSNKLNIPTIIIDFAHTPDALQRVLSDLFICKNSGKIILVFGCAGNRDKTKRAIMGNIAYNLADKIFITSDNSRNESFYAIFQDILSGINFNKNKIFCIIEDRKEAIKKAILEASNNDIVLIAGKGCEKIQEIRGDQKKISDNDIVKDILLEFF